MSQENIMALDTKTMLLVIKPSCRLDRRAYTARICSKK
jgi:hypothetical protein